MRILLPCLILLGFSCSRKPLVQVFASEKSLEAEMIRVSASPIPYQVTYPKIVHPGTDSNGVTHHSLGVRYELAFRLHFDAFIAGVGDTTDIELSGFQIVKYEQNQFWDDHEECFDTVQIIPKFNRLGRSEAAGGSKIEEEIRLEFVHFGSCRNTNLTILLADTALHTRQQWHK